MSKVIVIYGPTASGKSAQAIREAQRLNGEVINGDSMQLYSGLRILTARPSAADCALVPHHLYGVLGNNEVSSLGWWYDAALAAIKDVQARGKTPIVVGGTGLYLRSLKEGVAEIPAIPEEIRRNVRQKALEEDFFAYVVSIDPSVEKRLRPHDKQRLTRACEVMLATNQSLFLWHQLTAKKQDFEIVEKVLLPDRAVLYERINQRFDQMIEEGVLDEVKALMRETVRPDSPLLKAVGYPQLKDYLENRCTFVEAIEKSKQLSRNYAKRQLTWLRNQVINE